MGELRLDVGVGGGGGVFAEFLVEQSEVLEGVVAQDDVAVGVAIDFEKELNGVGG